MFFQYPIKKSINDFNADYIVDQLSAVEKKDFNPLYTYTMNTINAFSEFNSRNKLGKDNNKKKESRILFLRSKQFKSKLILTLYRNLGLNTRLPFLSVPVDFVSNFYKVVIKHFDLFSKKQEIIENVNFLIDLNSYKGLRLKSHLPARGQRTHTNSQTSRVVDPCFISTAARDQKF